MHPIQKGHLVSPDEDLRRAYWPQQSDERGYPTSAAFSYRDTSVDVASLASLDETRQRFSRSYVAVVPCFVFVEMGHHPEHDPEPDNIAHAIIPRRLSGKKPRRAAAAVVAVYPPVEAA